MRGILYTGIGAAVLVAGGFTLWHFSAATPAASVAAVDTAITQDASTTPAVAEPRPVPAQCGQSAGAVCVEYVNTKYHFSVFHSDQKTVQEFDEGGGAMTIVFQNTTNVHGFQIYVLPYSGTQVSEARFKEDEPSGVREGVTNITVDGATAAAFYSKDASLGDTFEVWFIHGGYLYEVTTLKSLEPNMMQRLQTWKFI